MRTGIGRALPALLFFAFVPTVSASQFHDWQNWPYLPTCAQCVTPIIYDRSGLDTTHAVIKAEVDEKAAAGHCANFHPLDDRAECTIRVLRDEGGIQYTAEADCTSGALTDAFDDNYQVVGTWYEGLAKGRARFVDAEGRPVSANGLDQGLTLSTQWAVLCPHSAIPERTSFEPGRAVNDIVGIDHNGSGMWHAADQGIIYYDKPKPSLRGLIAPGTVLFRGDPWSFNRGSKITGVAYTFRKNCEPAPYEVSGVVGEDRLVLKGAAPIREKGGCQVLGYSSDSSNAVLVFTFNYGDY